MLITKFGHACLLVEENRVRVLIDPGGEEYCAIPENLEDLSVILITHEHQDHYNVERIRKILEHNKSAQIVTNTAVGKKLKESKLDFQVIEDGQSITIHGLSIEGEGELHAVLHEEWPRCANTGYRIGGRLFHPGDSLELPKLPVEIIALPVGGPWMSIGMGIEYARAVKPKIAFPIHDGGLKNIGTTSRLPTELLPKSGIDVRILEIGKEYQF